VTSGLAPGLLLAIGVALLWGGAEALVRGAVGLATRLGVSSLVVGLTVVAFGTSMPELAVSAGAALDGLGDVAVGNVVGSNICNVGLILGLAALARPVVAETRLVRFDVPVAILVALLGGVMLWDDEIGRVEGAMLVALLLAYTAHCVRAGRREEIPATVRVDAPRPPRRAVFQVTLLLTGLALLVVGSRLFVEGALALSRRLEVAEAAVALTIVAVGTSLPELATSVVAAARGEGDVAAGNIVGSNIFNLLGILGISALVRPLQAPGIAHVEVLVMLGFTLALLPIMWSGSRIGRREGALLLLAYAAFVAWTYS
jgi:cation:H+ antiporter